MIIGVFAHIALLSGETARNGVRAAFTLGDPNLAANYFICSLLVLRAAPGTRGRRALRWLCCALIVTAIVLTGSNGGVLVLVITTVLGALFTLARRRGAAPAVITGAALVLAVLAIAPHVHVQGIVAAGPGELAAAQGLDRPPGGEQRLPQHHPVGVRTAVLHRRYPLRHRAGRDEVTRSRRISSATSRWPTTTTLPPCWSGVCSAASP